MSDRSVVVRLSAEASQYIATMQRAGQIGEDAMKGVEKAAMSQGQALDTLGNKSGKVAAATAAALFAVGKVAVDWESQFAGVEKTVEGTTSQLGELEEELRGLAKTMPATHEEIAATAEAAGQLGVARESVSDFTETMLQLGETTNLTADEAATAIAQMTNVMQTAPEDIDNLGAALVELGNNGASTERQIILMAQRIAAAGAQIGLAESDILAIANAAASMGIEVEAGGTSISRVFTELAKATAQGGPKLEEFARVAGFSADEFTRLFESTPADAFAAFIQGLDQINKSGGDVFTTLDQLGMSDVRVSQALLGMAASGDLLTDSLTQGREAWEENSALAEEFSKRLDTTAAEVQIAWNNIKDAGIDAGASMLPFISKASSAVSGMASAFQALPAPAQGAATSLAAITTVVGGSFWLGTKVVGSIRETKEALDALEASGGRTATAIGKVGKAAGGAIAALTVFGLAVEATAKSDPVPGLEATTKTLLELADGSAGAREELDALFTRESSSFAGTKEITGLVDALESLNTGSFSKLWSDPIFQDAEWDLAAQSFERVDQALERMVGDGRAAEAGQVFDVIAEAAAGVGMSVEDVEALLPGYVDKLIGVENATGDAASGLGLFADASRESASANQAEADAIAEAIDAMREKTSAALAGFDAETRWREAVKAATKQAEESAAGIRGSSDAALENRARLSELAGAWNNQSDAVKNAKGRFGEAKQTFIDTAVAMGVPEQAARDLARELLEIPPKRHTEVTVESQQAIAAAKAVQAHIDAIYGKTVFINVQTRYGPGIRTGAGGTNLEGNADGGTIRGPRYPYGDKVLMMGAPGEEIISNRRGQADRNRAALKAANAGAKLAVVGYADGGTVTGASAPVLTPAAAVRAPVAPGTLTVSLSDRDLDRIIEGVTTGSYKGTAKGAAEGMDSRARDLNRARHT